MNNKVVIFYNQLSPNPTPDEIDVLDQVNLVKDTLLELGYEPFELTMGYNMQPVVDFLKNLKPAFVVNLFESIENRCEFLYFGPALLNSLHIPYTGFPFEALFLTTHKVLTKQGLKQIGVPTPEWYNHETIHLINKEKLYIVKTIWEEGSLGLDEDCIFKGSDIDFINKFKSNRRSNAWFVEEYVEGRELNISILGSANGPEVLPPAEIQFIDYPDDKFKIVGYKAKWVEDSYEYNNTPRTFNLESIDEETLKNIKDVCAKTWDHFGGRGYARVDMRLSKDNIPYVLEINGNPCITPWGGYYAAVQNAGYTFKEAFERIIADAFR